MAFRCLGEYRISNQHCFSITVTRTLPNLPTCGRSKMRCNMPGNSCSYLNADVSGWSALGQCVLPPVQSRKVRIKSQPAGFWFPALLPNVFWLVCACVIQSSSRLTCTNASDKILCSFIQRLLCMLNRSRGSSFLACTPWTPRHLITNSSKPHH